MSRRWGHTPSQSQVKLPAPMDAGPADRSSPRWLEPMDMPKPHQPDIGPYKGLTPRPPLGATIPEDDRIEKITVATMPLNTSGYITSWMVEVDADWRVWVRGGSTLDDQPSGTVDTLVSRDDRGYSVATPKPADGIERTRPSSDAIPVHQFRWRGADHG